MWIVQVALRRPYTFLVMALVILLATPLVLLKMSTDIFPVIDIPVINIVWNYAGLSAQEMGQRITAVNERTLTTTVNDIEHIESQSLFGISVIKVFFQPNANIPTAIAQVVAIEQTQLRQMPPGTLPPLVIEYSASAIPVIQLGLSSATMSEQAVFDTAVNFLRPRLVTIPGVAIPWPFGGKQRVISVDLDTAALLAKGLTPTDVISAVNTQNLILPSGTTKIGGIEYVLGTNASPDTLEGLNRIPVMTRNGAQRAFDIASERYKGGIATYLDVITAEQTLLVNQRQAVQIHGQQFLTNVYLIKALGGGWAVAPATASRSD